MRLLKLILLVLFGTVSAYSAEFIDVRSLGCDYMFIAKTDSATAYIYPNSIVLSNIKTMSFGKELSVKYSGIEMSLSGSTPNPQVLLGSSSGKINYFNAQFNKSAKKINTYDELTLSNVYPGIDIRYYFQNENLRYDFIIHPNSNPEQIKLKFIGQQSAELNSNKELKLNLASGAIVHADLQTYSETKKLNIQSKFDILENGEIGFQLDNYNTDEKIIIDPLIYSTFAGGNDYDYARSMAVCKNGSSIITGNTSSLNFPVVAVSLDTTYYANQWGFKDVFVSKFDSSGKKLIFSTYIGGLGDDFGESVVIDSSETIYVAGYTISLHGFPTTAGAIDSLDQGGYDAFVLKLTPEGDSLIYSTLIGGKKDDFVQAMAIDSAGCAYITGYTDSAGGYPVSTAAFDTTYHGKYDVFVTKIDSLGNNIVYSTILGGIDDDFGQAIAVDKSGNAFIGGITRSNDFPTGPRAFDRSFNDTSSFSVGDGFVTQLNATGSQTIISSFVGGAFKDAVYGLVLNENNDMIICGYTESANFPISPDAYCREYGNLTTAGIAGDAFIGKVKYSGDSLVYSTFLGGKHTDRANALDLDSIGNIYVVGSTNSTDFPTTRFAFDKSYNDTLDRTDGFVSKFNPNMSKLLYSTYFGGINADIICDVEDFNNETIVIAGWTSSRDFPISANVFSQKLADTAKADIFSAKILPNLIDMYAGEDADICIGDTIQIGSQADGGLPPYKYKWFPASGLSSDTIASPLASPIGTTIYAVTATDSRNKSFTDTITIIVHSKPKPVIFGPVMAESNSTSEYYVPATKGNKYDWTVENGEIISGYGTYKVYIQWLDTTAKATLKIVETSPAGCSDSAEIKVYLGKTQHFKISYSGSTTMCQGDTLVLDAGAGYSNYYWSDGTFKQTTKVTHSGIYYVIASDDIGFLGISDTVKVTVNPTPSPTIEGRTTCKMNAAYSYVAKVPDKLNKYQWIVNGGAIVYGASADSTVIRWTRTDSTWIVLRETSPNGCVGYSDTMKIQISDIYKPILRIIGLTNFCIGDSTLLDGGYGYKKYTWSNGKKTRFIYIKTTGNYWCYVEDEYGFKASTDTVHLTVLPSPDKPWVDINSNVFTCQTNGVEYQWYRNDTLLAGATSRVYIAPMPGKYHVRIKAAEACFGYSDTIYYLVPSSIHYNKDNIIISPNPAIEHIDIFAPDEDYPISIEIFNSLGSVMLKQYIYSNCRISTHELAQGMYFVRLSSKSLKSTKQLLIVK